MELILRDKTTLIDGTKRYEIEVCNTERIYLGYFLESFEGWCNYTTPSKNEPYLRVDVSPNFEENF